MEKYTGVSSQDEAPTYSGEWNTALEDPTVAMSLAEMDAADIEALDYALNFAGINAMYFEPFFAEASDQDKGAMNIALSELHLADPQNKKIYAKTIAQLLEKY